MTEQIWAPWRLPYIVAAKKDDGCFLCDAGMEGDDRARFVVLRRPRTLCVLNRFPYTNGHLLVAPRAHKPSLAELDDEELLESGRTLRDMIAVLDQTIRPHGYNLGVNLGRVAGAGLPGHLHWHIVPRWEGDTNFMPVLGSVSVIPQALEEMYELLRRSG